MFQTKIEGFDPAIAIPMFIIWIIISLLVVILIYKKTIYSRISIILYLISLVLGGIILGAIPNAIMPIQQILITFRLGLPIISIIPIIIILILLLLTTLIVGRLFCSTACPVGALQELASKLNFKSNLKEQKKPKYKLEISRRTTNIIRGIFFIAIVLLSLIWGVALLQFINPFLGLNAFRNPEILVLLIPIITLSAILIASFFIYRPWCRFLCPFGAIAGLTSSLSLYKYRRTEACT
ncbi:MAG: 4Fe-4S binding protein, partial [Promethearchaeota archaeon]